MTRNPVGDAEAFSAAYWSGLTNAHDRERIVNGCDPTVGTGNWDVDISSGQVEVGGSAPDVSSQTVTLTAPASDADLDSGELRVDLITIDSSGSVTATEGTAAAGTEADPVIAANIPSDEVLVAAVTVDGDASALTSADINDYRILGSIEPYYGDGNSGSITDSSNQSRSGILRVTDYTLETGNTVTVSDSLIVVAQGSITINGTIDANGGGASGGSGGGLDGTNGSMGSFAPLGSGGSGGSAGGGAGTGGDGGDGDTSFSGLERHKQLFFGSHTLLELANNGAGAGGGRGGNAFEDSTNVNGGNGSAPGGAGGGSEGAAGSSISDGGAGGDGGGAIILIAPEITIGGTLQADGLDGADSSAADATGGGGGGGSGGLIALLCHQLMENSPTYSVAKGLGGTAPTGANATGGDGADGADGHIVKVT